MREYISIWIILVLLVILWLAYRAVFAVWYGAAVVLSWIRRGVRFLTRVTN
jgi:hypothetical protein